MHSEHQLEVLKKGVCLVVLSAKDKDERRSVTHLEPCKGTEHILIFTLPIVNLCTAGFHCFSVYLLYVGRKLSLHSKSR